MGKLPALSRRSVAGSIAGRVLLLVVAAMALWQAVQPLHVHRAASAGLYNEQHVLDALESIGGELPLPDAPPTPARDLIVGPSTLAAGARPSAPAARHADPRAPPLA